jgi:DNA polymerase-3 subunit delta
VPLLGGRPLVIIREGEGLGKEMQEALADYASAPVESSTLVVVAEKLDGRSRFMQAALKGGAIIECKPLYADRLPSWINMEVRRQGRQISQEAARFLADMVGGDLGQLAQSLERIVLYIGERRLIELRDVEEVIAETHQHNVFEFTDAVGTRRWPRALSLLTNILDNGEAPAMVLAMLARHFRILSKAKEIAGRLTDAAEIANYLGIRPFFVRNYTDQAKNFSKGELRDAFRLLHRCDRELKSSRLGKERILENALFSLMEQRGAAAEAGGTPSRGKC